MKCSKYLCMSLLLIICMALNVRTVNAANYTYSVNNVYDFSNDTHYLANGNGSGGAGKAVCNDANVMKAMKIIAYVIVIFKIMVPIIIVITGMISLVKATLNQDDSAIKSSISSLFKKFFIGVTIFFIPTIVDAILNTVKGYDNTSGQFSKCAQCMVSIKKCK